MQRLTTLILGGARREENSAALRIRSSKCLSCSWLSSNERSDFRAGLVVENDVERRAVDFQCAIVVNEFEFPEPT